MLAELHDISDMLELPGIAPPDRSSWTLGAAKATGNGRYTRPRAGRWSPVAGARQATNATNSVAKGAPATLVLNSSDERPMVAEGKV